MHNILFEVYLNITVYEQRRYSMCEYSDAALTAVVLSLRRAPSTSAQVAEISLMQTQSAYDTAAANTICD
jgi:hypothetical protein